MILNKKESLQLLKEMKKTRIENQTKKKKK